MAKQALLVTYRVRQGHMDSFLPVLKRHIAQVKATEPGCMQFDILMPQEEADTIRLYEVYADEDAFRIHNASEQLKKYRAESNPMLSEQRTIVRCTVVE